MTEKMTQAIIRHFKMASQARALSVNPSLDTFAETISDKILPTEHLKQLHEVPGPTGLASLPYIGTAFLFQPFTHHIPEKINLLFRDLHHRYGRIVKMRRGSHWNVFLFDPQLIMQAIQQEGAYPERPSMPIIDAYCKRKGVKKPLSSMQGEEWFRLRKPIQAKAMRPAIVDQYIPAQNKVADDFISVLSTCGDSDLSIENLLLRYAVESSGIFCFNSRQGFLDENLPEEKSTLLNSVHMYLSMVAESFYTFPAFKFFRTKLYTQFEKAADSIDTNSKKYLDRQIADYETKKANGTLHLADSNLLFSFLEDTTLEREQCKSVMTGFFVVATENAAKSLSIMLWHLAKHPEKQDKLYREIKETHRDTCEVTAKSLKHMPYLKACLRESHRLVFPTPGGAARIINKDISLDGYIISQGTMVHYGQNVLCHSPEYFPRPEEFIPERWLNDIDPVKHRIRSFIVMPFGFGPRSCLGKTLAERQIHLLVCKLLMKYKVSLKDPQESLDIIYKIIAANRTPLKINFEKREP
ncbi:probable cytochrome P450 49a1 [Gigantopelta aegis]|uniref:probable cytochrome P450 49a1 n=1 Tax=Gigantopelta aegis TaxID=1735272 RepID=UPI001B88A957|nr:probable cytochrome P450 49a1 [Gigantopelta aegis]